MSISRDAVMKKGGHAKKPRSLTSDLKRLVGSNTHGSMDNEPSYKRLKDYPTHKLRVGEPRRLLKTDVEKESPYNACSLHDDSEHNDHNKPRMGIYDNRIGLKHGGRARKAEGGDMDEKRRGGHMRKRAEGGDTEMKRRGGHCRKAEGGEPKRRGGAAKLQGHEWSERYLGGHPSAHDRHLEGYRAEGGEAKKHGGRTHHAMGGTGSASNAMMRKMGPNIPPITALKRGGRTKKAEGGMEKECHGGKMAKGGLWIQKAVGKHPGKLHRELHVPMGEKIPGKKLMHAEHSRNPTIRKEANLAKTLRGFHPKGRS